MPGALIIRLKMVNLSLVSLELNHALSLLGTQLPYELLKCEYVKRKKIKIVCIMNNPWVNCSLMQVKQALYLLAKNYPVVVTVSFNLGRHWGVS